MVVDIEDDRRKDSLNSILELRNVTKKRGSFVLEPMTLQIKPGEMVGLVGENGAGKTTLFRLILGIVQADSGQIKTVNKEKIGFVLDGDFFYESFTAKQAHRFFSAFYQTWEEEIYFGYLQQFSVPTNKPIRSLSKGMKVKFALATALSHHAQFLLLDEPTSGLDPFAREELLDVLFELHTQNSLAVLFSSHLITDIEKLAQRVLFLHQGVLQWDRPLAELLKNYWMIRGETASFDPVFLASSLGYRHWSSYTRVLVAIEPINASTQWQIQPATLEDIILYGRKES